VGTAYSIGMTQSERNGQLAMKGSKYMYNVYHDLNSHNSDVLKEFLPGASEPQVKENHSGLNQINVKPSQYETR
jgi:hypothetical protein